MFAQSVKKMVMLAGLCASFTLLADAKQASAPVVDSNLPQESINKAGLPTLDQLFVHGLTGPKAGTLNINGLTGDLPLTKGTVRFYSATNCASGTLGTSSALTSAAGLPIDTDISYPLSGTSFAALAFATLGASYTSVQSFSLQFSTADDLQNTTRAVSTAQCVCFASIVCSGSACTGSSTQGSTPSRGTCTYPS